jgi:hypothetical protein
LKNFTVPCTFVCSMIFDARVASLILACCQSSTHTDSAADAATELSLAPRQWFASTAEDVEIKRERGMDPSGWSVATLGWKAGAWFPLLLIFRSAKMYHCNDKAEQSPAERSYPRHKLRIRRTQLRAFGAQPD